MGTAKSQWLPRAARVLVWAGILNFVLFWVIGVAIGGDALNGRVEGDRYYLDQNGKPTEVSSAVFRYSRVHAVSVLVTLPLSIVCGGVLARYGQLLGVREDGG